MKAKKKGALRAKPGKELFSLSVHEGGWIKFGLVPGWEAKGCEWMCGASAEFLAEGLLKMARIYAHQFEKDSEEILDTLVQGLLYQLAAHCAYEAHRQEKNGEVSPL